MWGYLSVDSHQNHVCDGIQPVGKFKVELFTDTRCQGAPTQSEDAPFYNGAKGVTANDAYTSVRISAAGGAVTLYDNGCGTNCKTDGGGWIYLVASPMLNTQRPARTQTLDLGRNTCDRLCLHAWGACAHGLIAHGLNFILQGWAVFDWIIAIDC